MARRQIIQRKPRKARVTKSEEYIINLKYLGDEPKLRDDYTQSEYICTLNWYNIMVPIDEARNYLYTYLKNQNKNDLAKQLSKVPDSYFPRTAAWIARILTQGTKVNKESVSYMQEAIKRSLENIVEPKTTLAKKKPSGKAMSVRDFMLAKCASLFEAIDGFVDDYGFNVSETEFSVYDYLQKNNIPANYSSVLIARYQPYLDEIKAAVEKTDVECVELYYGIPKAEMQRMLNFFSTLISDLERYGSVKKALRKQRKPRALSVEKKLKHFKYLKEAKDYKVVSINPEKILGAQELWMFNTSSRTLTVFRALDRAGLSVKRASIIGYDEKTSMTKRTGRKTQEVIDSCVNGGKLVLRKLMDGLTTPAKLQERVTDMTVLIRIN